MNMHMCVSACAAAWLISEEPARLDRLLRKKNRRHFTVYTTTLRKTAASIHGGPAPTMAEADGPA